MRILFTFAGGQAPELDANNQEVLDPSGQPGAPLHLAVSNRLPF